MTIYGSRNEEEQALNPRKQYYHNPQKEWLKSTKWKNVGVAGQQLQLKKWNWMKIAEDTATNG